GETDESVKALLCEKFASIDRSNVVKIETEFKATADEVKKVDEKLAVKQGKLVMGLRTGLESENENFFPTRVMTDMFGGGPYSKLFMNVREKMSLCYYCSARFSKDKGIILVQSGIEDENEKKATDAILAELDNMKKGNFTSEEIENSKKGLTDAFLSVGDTPESIDAWIGARVLEEDIILPQEYAEKINLVTAEEIKAAAEKVTLDTIYMLSGDSTASEE
ncbi:MAG: insulinase family protein, partial [Clostridia bacterium]|nr:insulinase family protein [Clostridia bacterium]